MKRKLLALVGLILVGLLALLLGGCGGGSADQGGGPPASETAKAPEKITFKLASEGIAPAKDFATSFQAAVQQKFPGRVEVQLFTEGQLGDQKQLFEQIQMGTLDFAVVASAQNEAYRPYQVLEFPYIYRDREHLRKVMQGPLPEKLRDEMIAQKGVRTLAIVDGGFREVTNNVRQVTKPEDMKGLKIRTPKSTFRMDIFKAMGATPTPTSVSELFISIQQKIVDGCELPLQDIYDNSLYENQKYLALTNHIWTPVYAITNEKFWQGLPADVREGLAAAAREAQDKSFVTREQKEAEYVKKLEEKGMQVTQVDTAAFMQLMRETIWKNAAPEIQPLIEQIVNTQ